MLRGGGIGILPIAQGGTGAATAQAAAAAIGAPYALFMGPLPFISLSTGSVSAVGAISAITALPFAYPSAYCYFPANALATAIAAGWYYCTFSTTTAGTAFLNTYTSGTPTIPASPTAVSDGKGAFLGDTGEEFGPTITVPALGVNSSLDFDLYISATNNANVKTVRVRLSGNAGTIFLSEAATSKARSGFRGVIANTGATGKQFSYVPYHNGSNVTSEILGTVDTSVSTTAVVSLQKATATDNLVLAPSTVYLVY